MHPRDRPAQRGERGDTFLSPVFVSSSSDERPSSGFGLRRICRRASRRRRYEDSVVGGMPSSAASRVGVIGWNARIALCTAKSFGRSASGAGHRVAEEVVGELPEDEETEEDVASP